MKSIALVFFTLFMTPFVFGSGIETEVVVVKNQRSLKRAMKLLAEEGDGRFLSVEFKKGVYHLDQSLWVRRSHVWLWGNDGAELRLKDHVNQPVIAIGSQKPFVTTEDAISEIQISNLIIDGNQNNQNSELGVEKEWIRNNAIDVRATNKLTIREVVCRNARSGGLVISWKCDDVKVTDSIFEDNFFDGIAYYDSRNVRTENCVARKNGYAGISLDNDFGESEFVDCEVLDNGAVGIFARYSHGLLFEGCEIARSGDWAAFLAHDDNGDGVHDVVFDNCRFRDNRGGIFMASTDEEQSSGTVVRNCRFSGNRKTGRANVQSSGSKVLEEGNLEE